MFGLDKLFAKAGDAMSRLDRSAEVQKWLDELASADKREKKYLKEGQRCVEVYEADTTSNDSSEYNVLYANTDTLSPALYNSVPRPVVRPRFPGAPPIATHASRVLLNTLKFLVDSNQPQYTSFDDLMKTALLEALVPGRGCTRFKYDPTITDIPPTPEELAQDPNMEPAQRVDYETLCGEKVPWNRVRFGWALSWNEVPWVAFEHFMTRAECVDNFGEERGTAIDLTFTTEDSGDKKDKQPADAQGVQFAHIWEIWDKGSRKVLFVSDGAAEVVKEAEDPLKLEGFFPMPEPIVLLRRISSMVPQPLYVKYENQAKELDIITYRITQLTKMLKIRGFYDGTLTGLEQLLTKPDGTLLPAQNVAALQQGQSLEKSIWLMPLQEIVQALQQLYINRQNVKQVIYEITGIADIMRGSSAASETLGAQQLKEQWGTMRLKRSQKEVMRYTVDCLRMMAELASNHFSIETFKQMTGIRLPMATEKEQAQMQMQQMQQQGQALIAQAQQAGQQPPPPPPQMAELQKVLDLPSWEDVIGYLKNDTLRNFSIDIESNSTIDLEATEDKQDLAEFMNSLSQLMNGMMPLVEQGQLPFEAAKGILLAVIQKFRFGQEVEEQIKAMQAPPPKPDPKEKQIQAEMARDEKRFELEKQKATGEMELEKAKGMMELEMAKEKLGLAREEMGLKRDGMVLDNDFAQQKHARDLEMLTIKAAMPQGGSNASV